MFFHCENKKNVHLRLQMLALTPSRSHPDKRRCSSRESHPQPTTSPTQSLPFLLCIDLHWTKSFVCRDRRDFINLKMRYMRRSNSIIVQMLWMRDQKIPTIWVNTPFQILVPFIRHTIVRETPHFLSPNVFIELFFFFLSKQSITFTYSKLFYTHELHHHVLPQTFWPRKDCWLSQIDPNERNIRNQICWNRKGSIQRCYCKK